MSQGETSSALHDRFLAAIKQGNMAQVREYLERGADVHAVDQNGWPPLYRLNHFC